MPISSALGSSALLPAGLGFRNKVINGDMRINQRGASTTSVNIGYLVDRWAMYAGSNLTSLNTSTDAPAGFTNSIYAECTTASGPASYHGIVQLIEGNNIADLGFGTAWAKPIVVSFWVKSTKTGIANFSIANNGNLRTYTTTYTIDVANTWEKKIIYINGDTSGTWLTTSGMGVRLWWDLGSTAGYNATVNTWVGTDSIRTSSQTHNLTATLNARLYLTGVQVEQNYQPTPFEQRSYGLEMALCQRYYETSEGMTAVTAGSTGFGGNTYFGFVDFKVTKRIAPTLYIYDLYSPFTVNTMTVWQSASGQVQPAQNEGITTSGFHPTSKGYSRTDCGMGRFTWKVECEL